MELQRATTHHAVEDVLDGSADVDGWEVLQDVADGGSTVHEPHIILAAAARWEKTETKEVNNTTDDTGP